MKRNLMVFTAIASLAVPMATPLVAHAQDRGYQDRPAEPEGEARPQRRPNREEPRSNQSAAPDAPAARPQRPARNEQPSPPVRQEQPTSHDRPQRPERQERPGRPDRPAQPDAPSRPDRHTRPSDGSGWQGRTDSGRTSSQDQRNGSRYQQDDGRQNHRGDRYERRHDRREYRDFRDRFDSGQWSHNWYRNHHSDWWRDDHRFRNYSGFRMGFYFAPGYGYYNVPRSYWGQRWRVGSYLPSMFWRYQLSDWRTFGLGYPPPGTRWVVVDNQIYLIDQTDGYIIDVIYDAWNW